MCRLGWVATNFAALVREVKIRTEVEQIALRLECCFVDPFVLREALIRGGASIGISLYLEDGQAETRSSMSLMLRCTQKRRPQNTFCQPSLPPETVEL